MRYLILSIGIMVSFLQAISQESLQPLRYNQLLLNLSDKQKSNSALHETFIYLFDTLHLPVVDDFSTDKFKVFDAQVGESRVSDTTWYTLDSLGMVPFTTSYMTDTTYLYEYDTISGFGYDSLSIDTIPLTSGTIIVYDLNFYPITSSIVEVWPNKTKHDSLWTVASPDYVNVSSNPDLEQDTVTLYFVDTTALDLNYIWKDVFAFRNSNYPIDPISIGVATMDGLDENGYPYDWSSTSAFGVADYLTSKPIFLYTKSSGGNYDIGDSIYLSFLYQPEGLGEEPDYKDSLVLEFYAPDSNEWYSIWNTPGFSGNDWHMKNVKIDDTKYLKDGFQFRFKNYGSLTGNLDHWHIDYIILDDFRSIGDTIWKDWAFQNPINSMLSKYTAMPWSHYEPDPYSSILDNLSINTYNSDVIQKIHQDYYLDLLYDNSVIYSETYLPLITNVPALSQYDLLYDIKPAFFFDTVYADTFAIFDARFTLTTNTTGGLDENDTLFHQHVFHNYYAYDDGSAEAAYGLQGNGAELAYQFDLPAGITDTIKALKIHFSASVNNASTDPFFLQIWNDIGGEPGDTIYSTDDINLPVTYIPEYNLGVNGFYEYELPDKVAVSGTYYVGWKQSTSNRLNIGFDKNINNQNKIFYDLGSGWNNTGFQGSLMMRPVFVSDMDPILAGVDPSFAAEFNLYPNPASSEFYIDLADQQAQFCVYDLNGRLIKNGSVSNSVVIDVSFWQNGVYILSVQFENGAIGYQKIVINH